MMVYFKTDWSYAYHGELTKEKEHKHPQQLHKDIRYQSCSKDISFVLVTEITSQISCESLRRTEVLRPTRTLTHSDLLGVKYSGLLSRKLSSRLIET